jgi:hypothetical protein
MPALNIRFTDDEIARLRERAKDEGVSMRTMAHDTIVNSSDRAGEDALIRAAYERVKAISAGLLKRLAEK